MQLFRPLENTFPFDMGNNQKSLTNMESASDLIWPA